MRQINYNEINEVAEFKKICAGGYIAKITKVTDMPENEYLKIELDIADGEFKDYYAKLNTSRGFWGLSTVRSYKEKALPFFKVFVSAVHDSNIKPTKFIWDGKNEQQFVGKYVGIVLGEEEYRGKDGTLKTRVIITGFKSCRDILDGKFEVPALKKLANEVATTPFISAESNTNTTEFSF